MSGTLNVGENCSTSRQLELIRLPTLLQFMLANTKLSAASLSFVSLLSALKRHNVTPYRHCFLRCRYVDAVVYFVHYYHHHHHYLFNYFLVECRLRYLRLIVVFNFSYFLFTVRQHIM